MILSANARNDFVVLNKENYPGLPRKIEYEYINTKETDKVSLIDYLITCFIKYGDRIAIESEEKQINYKTVLDEALRVANAIMEQSMKKDNAVGLLFHHGYERIITIVGAIMAGKPFVCLDADSPEKRLKYFVEDANLNLLIVGAGAEAQGKELCGVNAGNMDVLYYNEILRTHHAVAYKKPSVTADDVAILLYTSGSSGMPKGVMQTYKNIFFHVASYLNSMKVNQQDRVALLTPYTHAVAYIDILSTFFAGATLMLFDVWSDNHVSNIGEWLSNKGITVYHSVPTLFRYIMNKTGKDACYNSLRLVVLGGECVNIKDWRLYKEHCSRNCVFVNFFGSTEVMTASFCYLDYDTEPTTNVIPIGYFIEGVDVAFKKEEAAFEPNEGEIVYLSEYITPGYWRRSNSFSDKKRVFCGGDLGRVMPDGQMEHLGRKDSMVKICGKRVDLLEIESTLLGMLPMDKCLVSAEKTEYATDAIIVYYTTPDKKKLNEKHIMGVLEQILPTYMLPSRFVHQDEFSLTPNGKVDRLKIISQCKMEEESKQEISTDIQMQLAGLWMKQLDVAEVTLQSNFVHLGGNSLHMMSLINDIRECFWIDITILDIINNLCLEDMADMISLRLQERKSEDEKYRETELTKLKTTEDIYPLTPAQRRIYIHLAQSGSKLSYNQTMCYKLQGKFEIQKANKAIKELIKRHCVLRTAIVSIDGETKQKVWGNVDAQIELYNGAEEEKTILNKFVREFDLGKPPLVRFGYYGTDDTSGLLMLDIHHIIADGTSVNILMNEFIVLYNGGFLPRQEKDYYDCISDEEERKPENTCEEYEYWKNMFSNKTWPYTFYSDDSRKGAGAEYAETIVLNTDCTGQLTEIARKNDTTLFSVLLAAYFIMLYRYNAQETITVCVPTAGRKEGAQRNIVGLFINILPIKCQMTGKMKLSELLQKVSIAVFEALQNQNTPFERIVEFVRENSQSEVSSLFNLMFVLQNMNQEMLELQGNTLQHLDLERNLTAYDLAWVVSIKQGEIHINCKYNKELIGRNFVVGMLRHYKKTIEILLKDTSGTIDGFDILTEPDMKKLCEFNNTKVDFPRDMTVNKMFERQAVCKKNHTAVVYNDVSYTYEEFNQYANQLAQFLKKKGIGKGHIVAIMLERSEYMLVAIMAVHKVGAAYLPISPEYPKFRINYMLEDSDSKIILTDSSVEDITQTTAESILLDRVDLSDYSKEIEVSLSEPDSVAYLIYTSGTTGMPKAVAVKHASLVNFFAWMQSKFSIQGEAVILQKTPFVFDASMREVLWYGMYGMTLAVLPPGDEKKPEKIVQDIWKYKVTHINFVPSMLNAFLLYLEGLPEKVSLCQSLQYVFCCGEPLTTSLAKRFYGIFHRISLCNLYGPTEATIDVTYYPCDPNNIPEYIPIGYPLNNCRIYIINPSNQLQPIGTVGELCIAGECLSAGYYNKPDITQQKYVPNPFEDGGKLYHSGDLARWLPDGKIQCLGRIDHQVKIRGYRIELEEIRKYLLQIDAIKETVLTVCSDENGDKFICAYCIFNRVITVSEIMQILLQNLPEYMVPSFFVSIDEIPTNTNGKLAKDKLPLPVTNIPIGSTYEPPETKEEKMLAEVWREVLNVDQVGVYDNFFHLGGNSIKAIQVVSVLKRKYNAELLLDKMYALESVRELALEITYGKREEDMVQAIEKREYYPLSSAQNRIYLSSALKSNGQADNNSILTYRIQGELAPVRLKAAFQSIINNHEILRTTYHLLEGTVYQKVEENIEFTLEEVTMQENESIDDVFREFNTVFDLTAAPLIRATVVHMKPKEFFLFIAVHHIAFDGFSRNILIEELSKGYENRLCEKPEFQYKEYAYYQTKNLSSDRMQASEQYWMEQFKQLPPEKELFTDFERPSEVDFSGDSVMFSVPPDVVEKVHNIAEKNQATDFQVMFSAYSLLLNKYSNIDDIVIGIPEVGRNVRGTESLIGMFVNTLPIRTYPNGDQTVKSFIQEIKTGLIAAMTHDEYPYDVLVRKLKIKPNLGRNPLFDTMFAFQNIETTELNLSGVVTELYPIADQASIFDLVLYIYAGEKMEGKFSFSKKIYKESTINMLIQDYICLIRQMDIDNEITLDEILTTKDNARKEQMKKHKIEFNF